MRLELPQPILDCGVIAIARHVHPDRINDAADALVSAGVRAIEVTLNSRDAFGAIERLASADNGILIGAGTVMDETEAEKVVAAGATFLVMPHTDPALIGWALEHRVPVVPGAMTPTEILTAWRAGATAVKVFPSSVIGPNFLRDVKGPLPHIPIVPTGGIDQTNAAAFIAQGAVAVGVGSWLIGDGEPEGVRRRAIEIRNLIDEARHKG